MKKKKPPMQIAKRNEVYDWGAWADGKWHELKEGEDFHISLEIFRSGVCAHARRHNWSVMTRKVPTPLNQPQILAIKLKAIR